MQLLNRARPSSVKKSHCGQCKRSIPALPDIWPAVHVSAQVFRESVQGMFEQLRTAHIAVFVISLAWGLLLWLGLVRPMLRRSGKESRQIAEMLSQLPAEMDVEALVGQALVKTGVLKR